jgi:predicted component of type VI protein secretion system
LATLRPPCWPWSGRAAWGRMGPMPTLILYYPEKEKRWKVDVEGDSFAIGRSRDSQVCLPHTSVSKKHLLVERKGKRYVFRDLGSKNGVIVNGFRMSKGTLEDGDELQIGSLFITFYSDGGPAIVPAPAVTRGDARAANGGAAANDAAGLAHPRDGEDAPVRLGVPETPILPQLSVDDLERELEGSSDEPAGTATLHISRDDPRLHYLLRQPVRRRPDGDEEWEKSQAERGQPKASGPNPFRRGAILLGMGACLSVGLLLGYLGGKLDGNAPSAGEVVPAASTRPAAQSAQPPAVQPAPAAPAAPEYPWAPADLRDAGTAKRMIVRLFLDLAGRPPIRDELARLDKASPEKIYDAARSQIPTGPEASPPRLSDNLPEVFERLMGRKPAGPEDEKIRQESGGDADHYAFALATSAAYCDPSRKRPRTKEQLARSLLVDLLAELPERAKVTKTLAAIDSKAPNAVQAVAVAIAGVADASRAGPREKVSPEDWLRDAYARLLLRQPSATELASAKTQLSSGPDAWRAILSELASREEYLSY